MSFEWKHFRSITLVLNSAESISRLWWIVVIHHRYWFKYDYKNVVIQSINLVWTVNELLMGITGYWKLEFDASFEYNIM